MCCAQANPDEIEIFLFKQLFDQVSPSARRQNQAVPQTQQLRSRRTPIDLLAYEWTPKITLKPTLQLARNEARAQ